MELQSLLELSLSHVSSAAVDFIMIGLPRLKDPNICAEAKMSELAEYIKVRSPLTL